MKITRYCIKYLTGLFFFFLIFSAGHAWAVNGVNLYGIGPVSRSMGGVGIAAPQDSVSSIFSNPATMSFTPFNVKTQMDVGATLLTRLADSTKVSSEAGGTVKAEVNNAYFLVPVVGVTTPISNNWHFGLGLAGTTGLGMDYKETDLDQPTYFSGTYPLISGYFTQLGAVKLAPSISAKLSDKVSLGMSLHIDQVSADLGEGTSFGYTWGIQAGLLYKPTDSLSFGMTYISPQSADLDRVADLNGDGSKDDLELALPQQAGIGISFATLEKRLLLEADIKWINWSDADAWEEFDWDDQWVFGLGAQFFIIPKLALRAGYNYGKSPVNEHDGFNGAMGSTTNIQGKDVPTYYYETLRSIGVTLRNNLT